MEGDGGGEISLAALEEKPLSSSLGGDKVRTSPIWASGSEVRRWWEEEVK